MFKIILKGFLLGWLTIMGTNIIIMMLFFDPQNPNPEIVKHLTFFNSLFWGFHFGNDIGKELRAYKDGQNTKGKDDSRDS